MAPRLRYTLNRRAEEAQGLGFTPDRLVPLLAAPETSLCPVFGGATCALVSVPEAFVTPRYFHSPPNAAIDPANLYTGSLHEGLCPRLVNGDDCRNLFPCVWPGQPNV
ncbi:hypothetical protein KPH14_013051 [Odynerus spinipes]|uniref:Uncharacterized protein n=1 Tax=Odynerus spinipes TaxID=1348599 RepID=A0AAD9R8F5_9HYME|nr:hypothetical protein KPH14_013051 [Odynerus spinipes]